jgi:hypothetical protein
VGKEWRHKGGFIDDKKNEAGRDVPDAVQAGANGAVITITCTILDHKCQVTNDDFTNENKIRKSELQ